MYLLYLHLRYAFYVYVFYIWMGLHGILLKHLEGKIVPIMVYVYILRKERNSLTVVKTVPISRFSCSIHYSTCYG